MDATGIAEQLTILPFTPERWADLETLFGHSTGASCWCMWWRVPNKEFDSGEGNKHAFRMLTDTLCERGINPGLLAYADSAPVGWISLGPRTDYRRFDSMRSDTFKPVDATPVWSVVCFFIERTWRRKGVAGAMLKSAIGYAHAHGAEVLEAYPTDVEEKAASSSIFMGTQSLFAAAGFVEVGRRKPARPIMRLKLSSNN